MVQDAKNVELRLRLIKASRAADEATRAVDKANAALKSARQTWYAAQRAAHAAGMTQNDINRVFQTHTGTPTPSGLTCSRRECDCWCYIREVD